MRLLAVIVMIVISILLVNTLAVSGQEDSSNSAQISGDIAGSPCYSGENDIISRLENFFRNTCIDEDTVGRYSCSKNGVWELRDTEFCEGDSWSCEEELGGGLRVVYKRFLHLKMGAVEILVKGMSFL